MNISDWNREQTSDGILLVHPDGLKLGMVRVRRGQPAQTLAAVLGCARAASPMPTFPTAVRRIVTNAGEHAGICALEDSTSTRRWIALIDGDGRATLVQGVCLRGAGHGFAGAFEDFVVNSATDGAKDRIRMFEYTPPCGWHAMRRVLSTLFLAKDYPRRRSTIEVFDAIPRNDKLASNLDALLAPAKKAEPTRFTSANGLDGTVAVSDGTVQAELLCERFRYRIVAHSDSDSDGDLRSLEVTATTLLDSVVPIPSAKPAVADTPLEELSMPWAL